MVTVLTPGGGVEKLRFPASTHGDLCSVVDSPRLRFTSVPPCLLVGQGTASSGLASCVEDLRALEASTRKHAKANRRDGLPLFENGHWQEVLGRFVTFLSGDDEVGVAVGWMGR